MSRDHRHRTSVAIALALIVVGAACSSSSSGPSGPRACKVTSATLCECSGLYTGASIPCDETTVGNTLGAQGAACCQYANAAGTCTCSAFACGPLGGSGCLCTWPGGNSQQSTTCTGTVCCAQQPSAAGGGTPGECECGDTPCTSYQPAGAWTQVAQCDLTTTPPACPPNSTQVTSCK